ncbi:MAG TPA: AraC family transcriptional regulator [Chthonomonadaceae bacterium]|nr:AraC family transcriptional regulator [Chthonomonadaceae bacterium]
MTGFVTTTAFADPKTTDWSAPCALYGWPNLVHRAHATRVYLPEHYGVLSVKCAFHGRETYEVAGRSLPVEDTIYLILNEGQRYASSIDSDMPVESISIFFNPTFARSVLRSLRDSHEKLMDDPTHFGPDPCFFERLYPHDQIVSPVLFRMREALQAGPVEEGWLEEQYHLLLARLLAAHCRLYAEAERLSAVKRSTRLDLYQRLYWAKDFMDSNLGEPLKLDQIAEIACLSPHHFLRLFKELFLMTPHQYLICRRLEMAQSLLKKTEMPVMDICLEVGFTSLGTFSCLFRRRHGITPGQYRRDHSASLYAITCDLRKMDREQ